MYTKPLHTSFCGPHNIYKVFLAGILSNTVYGVHIRFWSPQTCPRKVVQNLIIDVHWVFRQGNVETCNAIMYGVYTYLILSRQHSCTSIASLADPHDNNPVPYRCFADQCSLKTSVFVLLYKLQVPQSTHTYLHAVIAYSIHRLQAVVAYSIHLCTLS